MGMKQQEASSEFGVIRIHKKAISSAAAIAACEIEGVKGLGKNMRQQIINIIRNDRSSNAISVDIDLNGEVRIDVPLVIKYGFNIPDTASQVQENIRKNLEKTTNLNIKDINISVRGIERG